ncbi:MAG: hypothetical protein ACE5JL_08750 [Dehalococcoidia bacterium]
MSKHRQGFDYPVFSYVRLIAEWETERFKPDVLGKVFYENAQRNLILQV